METKSPTDSLSKKSMKSSMSERLGQRPITRSMISLPIITRHSSPLSQNPVTDDEINRYQITRAAPQPQGRRIRASDLEHIKLQPSSLTSDIGTASSPLPPPTSFSHEGNVACSTTEGLPWLDLPQNFRAPLRLVLPAPLNNSWNKSSSNPIIRKPLPSYSRPLSYQSQSAIRAVPGPSCPSRSHHSKPSFSNDIVHQRPLMERTFSTIEPSSVLLDRSRELSGKYCLYHVRCICSFFKQV